MKKKKHISYEAEYFTGQFRGSVGDFTPRDLAISKSWFHGWMRLILNHADISDGRGKRALEIGSAIGGAANILKDWGYDVWGADISSYAMERATTLSPDIRFSVLDIQKPIPFRERFDLIVSFEVVEHLQHPERALENMYNALDDGGTVVISTPYPHPWNYRDPTHINVRHPSEWIDMMGTAGFVDMQYHAYSMLPFFYKIHPSFHISLPFMIPLSFINNPNFFIGYKRGVSTRTKRKPTAAKPHNSKKTHT